MASSINVVWLPIYARGERGLEAERVTNGKNLLPDLDRAGITKLQSGELLSLGIDLYERDVIPLVGSDVFRGMMRLISQNHFNGLRAFHNVIVGQDVAPRIDDETGPGAFHGNRVHKEIVLRRFRQDIRHRR